MSNIPTVQAIYQAFSQGNVAAILDQLEDDVVWERGSADYGVPWLTPGRGKAHVAGFFAAISAFDMTRFEPTNLLEGGDQVAAVIQVQLTVKATGASLVDEELHLWTFSPDGKVRSFRHVLDTAKHIAAFRGAPAAV